MLKKFESNRLFSAIEMEKEDMRRLTVDEESEPVKKKVKVDKKEVETKTKKEDDDDSAFDMFADDLSRKVSTLRGIFFKKNVLP